MKPKFGRRLTGLVLLSVFLASLLTSCTLPLETIIHFEDLPISNYYYRNENSAQIWVITGGQQYNRPQDIEWRSDNQNQSEPPHEINNFDFSEYFLMLVFNGFRANYGTGMEIKAIWQDKEIIYVSAHLDDEYPGMTVIPIWSSQYSVLKISKSTMTQFGKITFILLDESGKERAKVTYEVSK